MEASFAKTVSEADILAFAEVTGDKNPVHLDAEVRRRHHVQDSASPTAC